MAQRRDPAGTRFQHVLIAVLAAGVVVHSIVIAVWLAPSSPLKTHGTTDLVARYVDPYFVQSWDTLDPSSQRVDEQLRFRAKVRGEGGKVTVTPWVDLTAADLAAVKHQVFTPRVHLAARRLATNLNARYIGLDAKARKVVAKDFTADVDSATKLRIALRSAGTSPLAVALYVNVDRMTVRFGSLYAIARWGSGVQQVQYASGFRRAPERKKRDSIHTVSFTKASFGWRRIVRPEAGAQASFDSWVEPAPDGEKR